MATLCFKWGLNQIFEKPQATYGNWRHTRLFLPWVKGIKWLICVGPSPGGSSWSSHSRSWTVRVTLMHTSSAGCWQALLLKLAGAGRWGGYIGFVFPLDSMWHLYNLGTCLICDLWALGEPTQNVSLLRPHVCLETSTRVHAWNFHKAQKLPKRKLVPAPFTEHLLCAVHCFVHLVCVDTLTFATFLWDDR